MCGIAGFQGAFDRAVLTRMSAAICHRGPDNAGEWIDAESGTALAHRRLSIIDVSPLGNQPMTDESTASVMVFNGEIYNYRELRRDLEAQGHRFRSASDSEVLLALYAAHGDGMVSMLNGIFAFAIQDRRTDTLFVACDSMAIKPLYYAEGADGFLFASELKSLLAAGTIDRSLDLASLYRTLGFLWTPAGHTPFQNVRRLGPGEALRVRGGRVDRRWTWAPPAWTTPIRETMSDADAVDAVTAAVRTAVHRQMVADVPVGAFLSGGLDSSTIVAMAREVSPRIDCFTIDSGEALDAGFVDDLPYARLAARHLGVPLHEIRVDSARMAADLERMVFQLDEPLADPAPLNVLYISQLARDTGMKVLLSGAGGDDLFTGYRRHRAVMMEPYWSWLPKPARRGLRHAGAALGTTSTIGRRIGKAFAHADWSAEQRLAGYFLWAEPSRVLGLFAPENREALRGVSMTAPLEEYAASLPLTDPLQRMLALEQRFYLPDHNLLYTDKMSMATAIETRVPFLDEDLMRLANTLPSRVKQRGAEGKWVLKKAMEPYLPREIIYRPKTGFGAPLRRWLRNELRELVDDTLSESTLRRRGIFDPSAVARLVADDREGRVDAAYTILGLMCIEIWCRSFAA